MVAGGRAPTVSAPADADGLVTSVINGFAVLHLLSRTASARITVHVVLIRSLVASTQSATVSISASVTAVGVSQDWTTTLDSLHLSKAIATAAARKVLAKDRTVPYNRRLRCGGRANPMARAVQPREDHKVATPGTDFRIPISRPGVGGRSASRQQATFLGH